MRLEIRKLDPHWRWEAEREDGAEYYGYSPDLDSAIGEAADAMTCPESELAKYEVIE